MKDEGRAAVLKDDARAVLIQGDTLKEEVMGGHFAGREHFLVEWLMQDEILLQKR